MLKKQIPLKQEILMIINHSKVLKMMRPKNQIPINPKKQMNKKKKLNITIKIKINKLLVKSKIIKI